VTAAHHTYLEAAAKPIFEQLAQENHLVGLEAAAFSERAAHYLGEINALHPFREGNGRAQREFINHLAYENGYFIAWSAISAADMVRASIESFHTGNTVKFAELIRTNLRKRPRMMKKRKNIERLAA
jgi:cell filamentation protein